MLQLASCLHSTVKQAFLGVLFGLKFGIFESKYLLHFALPLMVINGKKAMNVIRFFSDFCVAISTTHF